MVRLTLKPKGGGHQIKLTNENVTTVDTFQNILKLLLEVYTECETLFEGIKIDFIEENNNVNG